MRAGFLCYTAVLSSLSVQNVASLIEVAPEGIESQLGSLRWLIPAWSTSTIPITGLQESLALESFSFSSSLPEVSYAPQPTLAGARLERALTPALQAKSPRVAGMVFLLSSP